MEAKKGLDDLYDEGFILIALMQTTSEFTFSNQLQTNQQSMVNTSTSPVAIEIGHGLSFFPFLFCFFLFIYFFCLEVVT